MPTPNFSRPSFGMDDGRGRPSVPVSLPEQDAQDRAYLRELLAGQYKPHITIQCMRDAARETHVQNEKLNQILASIALVNTRLDEMQYDMATKAGVDARLETLEAGVITRLETLDTGVESAFEQIIQKSTEMLMQRQRQAQHEQIGQLAQPGHSTDGNDIPYSPPALVDLAQSWHESFDSSSPSRRPGRGHLSFSEVHPDEQDGASDRVQSSDDEPGTPPDTPNNHTSLGGYHPEVEALRIHLLQANQDYQKKQLSRKPFASDLRFIWKFIRGIANKKLRVSYEDALVARFPQLVRRIPLCDKKQERRITIKAAMTWGQAASILKSSQFLIPDSLRMTPRPLATPHTAATALSD